MVVVLVALSQCKKEPEKPYSNDNIMLDNAQAALYFHAIFCEAEHAWAFVAEKEYEPGTYSDPANKPTVTKIYTYNASTNDVTINYNAWVANNLLLAGTLRVNFPIDSYRSDGKVAKVFLTNFSINGQDIKGEPSFKYKKSEKDQYIYDFIDGAIHELGVSMPVLISGRIDSGQYERIEGGETLSQDDDVWAYSGTMTGMLHDDPKLTYTNKVLTTFVDENGENGIIHFTMNSSCKTAKKGVAQITIPGRRPDIIYGYFCSRVDFITVEHIL